MGTHRMRDLIQATGVTERTVRFYVARGVLPRPEGRGTGPIYTEEHLLRLRAVRHLRAQRVSLDDIVARLAGLSREQLTRLVAPSPPPSPATSTTSAGPLAATGEARGYTAERWERVPLLPGLELHVRGDAGPLVHRLAAEIHARYCAGGAPSAVVATG